MKLRVALVGGPAYDPLYETLAQFTGGISIGAALDRMTSAIRAVVSAG